MFIVYIFVAKNFNVVRSQIPIPISSVGQHMTCYLYKMVVQNMLSTYEKKNLFRKKIGFDNSFDVTKCLQHIEIPDLLRMGAW